MAKQGLTADEQEADVRGLLLAIATLLADQREAGLGGRPNAARTEVLLADVGLPNGLIAAILGKQPDAIRMAVSRARKRSGTTGKKLA